MNDPNARLNALRAWLQFYDDSHMNEGPVSNPFSIGSGAGSNPSGDGGRMAWAMAQAQGQDAPQQDYFANLPQRPDPTQGYNRLAAIMGRRF